MQEKIALIYRNFRGNMGGDQKLTQRGRSE